MFKHYNSYKHSIKRKGPIYSSHLKVRTYTNLTLVHWFVIFLKTTRSHYTTYSSPVTKDTRGKCGHQPSLLRSYYLNVLPSSVRRFNLDSLLGGSSRRTLNSLVLHFFFIYKQPNSVTPKFQTDNVDNFSDRTVCLNWLY